MHSSTSSDLRVIPGWLPGENTRFLATIRALFEFDAGDRATGVLWGEDREWPTTIAAEGRLLLALLWRDTDVKFEIVAFQAYRNGSGCDWHADAPFDAQAVLSLGATRTFGIRPVGGEPEYWPVSHGDLVFMPPGFQLTHEHCVPVEDEPGERISLVFRTVARG